MAGFVSGHVTVQDIRNASEALTLPDLVQQESYHFRTNQATDVPDVPRHVSDVGINYNKWRRPVKEFGPGDTGLLEHILRHDLIRDFDVDPDDWKKSVRAINILMENVLLKEFQTQAGYYEGLSIKKYIKQGSSREGLKTRKADEFDTVLLFDIEGLSLEPVTIGTQPGLGKICTSILCESRGSNYKTDTRNTRDHSNTRSPLK